MFSFCTPQIIGPQKICLEFCPCQGGVCKDLFEVNIEKPAAANIDVDTGLVERPRRWDPVHAFCRHTRGEPAGYNQL